MTRVESTSVAKTTAMSAWWGESKATLMLGLPLIGAQLAQMAINATDALMIGWLGATELAASVLALQLFFLTWLAGLGFLQAVMPLASRAEGKGDIRNVRRASRMGLWISLIYTSIAMVVLWNGESILLALGQKPEVAEIAASYLRIVQWSMYPSLFVMALRSFLTSIERSQIVLWATVVSAIVNAALDYVLIFGYYGFPKLGILGAGIASVATALAACLILIAYVLWEEKSRRYELFVRFWRADWPAFAEILRLGWPISLMLVAEVGLFSAAALMMGWIGTLELAAHGIAVQLSGIAFMIPLGFANAAVVRVGIALGRNDVDGITRAAWVAIIWAILIGILGAVLFVAIPEVLLGLYLDASNPDAADVIRIGVPLVLIAAIYMVVDGIQVVAGGVLRGLSDTRVPMVIAVVGYWFIGVPLSYVMAFTFDWGPEGIWVGLAMGLFVTGILLLIRFQCRDKLGLVRLG
ncbi:Multidrug resistance protein MdtK [Pseudovibrio axinellae]|uniref:Multidrug-efflux transporter n=1 Tax=Pseudovibrio axinellae TaxID=989403 RepID=A0A166AAM3_9HYPH|nr:MATE family efflux transporter [Pseudovibrio axinellae]KZL20794.1 Multidrug resistance protein MdtK [Pseudovibrio axinellae]SER22384.1 multidrug resistance protein, MATE family [Pseudovibrio axinellae]